MKKRAEPKPSAPQSLHDGWTSGNQPRSFAGKKT
jgi:hypothetical protein